MRWTGDARVVECRYCGAHVLTPTGQITEERADARTQVRPRNAAITVVLVLGANLGVGLLIMLLTQFGSHAPGTLGAVPIATLATTPLQGTHAGLAAALGLEPDEGASSLYAPLRGSDFDYAVLSWDDAHPENPAGACFYASDGHPRAAAVVARLAALLGRRFATESDGGHRWRWAGAQAWGPADLSNLCFNVDPEDDPQWAYRARLLWTVVLTAALEQDVALAETTRKVWLAGGYHLREVAALDLRYDVDGAQAYVASVLPGGSARASGGLAVSVPLAHPWFGAAELSWPNRPGGLLESVRLTPAPGEDRMVRQTEVARCLDAALGRGEVSEVDHLARTWAETWAPGDTTRVRVDEYSVWIDLDDAARGLRARTFKRVLLALDACG